MTIAALLGSIPSPGSSSISIGPLELRAYGLAIAVGVIVAVTMAQRRWAARGGDPADVSSLATWSVIAGLVGARAYHVLTDYHRFQGRWPDALKVWEGGLGIPGGLPAARLLDVVVRVNIWTSLIAIGAATASLALLRHRERTAPAPAPRASSTTH